MPANSPLAPHCGTVRFPKRRCKPDGSSCHRREAFLGASAKRRIFSLDIRINSVYAGFRQGRPRKIALLDHRKGIVCSRAIESKLPAGGT